MSDFEDYRGEDLENEALNEMLEEAEQQASDDNYDEAIGILNDAVEKFPESVLAHYNLGVANYMLLKNDLDHAEYWEDYADEEGYYEESISEFQQTLELDPDFVPALNNLGNLFALREMWEEALEQFERSVGVNPDQPEIDEKIKEIKDALEEAGEDLDEDEEESQ